MLYLFLNFRRRKNDDNPLSNDRIPKPTKRRYTTIKIPFPMINVEDELCSLLLVVIIDGR